MEKRIAFFAVTIMIVGASGPAVLALSPMGPPKAMLGQDQWAVGVEYAHESMDLEAFGTYRNIEHIPEDFIRTDKGEFNIKDLKSNVILGRVSYGVSDNWEAFLRLGAADAECDIEQTFTNAPPFEFRGFDGSFGFAWGFGTKVTIWEDTDISWGGLFQMTWMDPGDSSIESTIMPGSLTYEGDAEIEFWEIQLALGPTWRMEDNINIYGGPFLHFAGGDLDFCGSIIDPGVGIDMESAGDIEEKSQLGGYVGASWDVSDRTSCFIEYQITGDAWGIGLGAARKF